MTDRKPGGHIIVACNHSSDIAVYPTGDDEGIWIDAGHEMAVPVHYDAAHALAAAITTLAAEAGHPAPVAGSDLISREAAITAARWATRFRSDTVFADVVNAINSMPAALTQPQEAHHD